MTEDVYVRLREFLDRKPGGFPATDSGVEYRILERYFTPEEAEIVMQLAPMPEPPAAIAARTGMDEAALAEKLEKMAREGSINRIRIEGAPYYMPLQFLIGLYEFHLNSLDAEMARMLEEYIPHLVKSWEATPTKQLRVIPVEASIDTTGSVATYDQARELIKGQERIAVADCICRKEKKLLGRGCDHPLETCLTFGIAADYYIENGIGREITHEECLGILEKTEKAGMVLAPSNAQAVMNICICCGDSCTFLNGIKLYERPADHTASNFQAKVEAELCTRCGICLDRCQMGAMVEGDKAMDVNTARCIGCGLCVTTCPEQAVTMAPKAAPMEPPENFIAMQMKIAADRGLV